MSRCWGPHETRRRRSNQLHLERVATRVQSHQAMRRLAILVFAILTTGHARARAEPIAVAVNLPVAWPWSVGASAWVGVDEHHAIRANFARYRGPLWQIIP